MSSGDSGSVQGPPPEVSSDDAFTVSVPREARYTPPVPLVSHGRRELQLKLVYYGPGLGGKTTNLSHIHGHSRADTRGKLISLMTEAERTLFFDLLPMELGLFRDYRVRLHLCTVPGQIALDTTRQLVLRNVDGIVFVVDSQRGRMEANHESIRNLWDNLRLQGDDPDRMPMVVQYNKRDLPGATPIAELREELGIPAGVPEFEASAVDGVGVFETLKAITRECLKLIPDPSRLPEGRTDSVMLEKRPSLYPEELGASPSSAPPAAVEVSVPVAARVPQLRREPS